MQSTATSSVQSILQQGAQRLLAAVASFRDSVSHFPAGQDASESGIEKAPSSLLEFENALANVHTRSVLRERLERRDGNGCFEFLISARSFQESRNPLQRFQLLRALVHRFVRADAERPLPLSDACRRELLRECGAWIDKERVPAGARLDSLKKATHEIQRLLAATPHESTEPCRALAFGIDVKRARASYDAMTKKKPEEDGSCSMPGRSSSPSRTRASA
ncbi:MAG TPA: hypothetical protein VHA82_14480 [Ramlibacter sp.]|uniref:hypothetical protein n=1 Tax=Ramlibacter sp. TaxID=1917967 RepID=UPI002C1CF0AA|nr:hypothetical protein [Ramlibacter sp.]HVZ45013.1 hypothetical protein [Ramlibacter sp.]